MPTRDDGSDLVANGLVDIAPHLDTLAVIKDHPDAGVLPIEAPQPTYVALHYNVRPGFLFADRNLRLALQHCVDLRRIIDAATGDGRQTITSPFMPGPRVTPRTCRSLPGTSPGRRGSSKRRDGASGPMASTQRAGRGSPPGSSSGGLRVRAASQDGRPHRPAGRDCGTGFVSRPVRFDEDIRALIADYPIRSRDQTALRPVPGCPGAASPIPAPMTAAFDSRLISGPTRPDGNANDMIGFRDPEVDRLIDAGLATYDQSERASITAPCKSSSRRNNPCSSSGAPGGWASLPPRPCPRPGGRSIVRHPAGIAQPETLIVRLAGT